MKILDFKKFILNEDTTPTTDSDSSKLTQTPQVATKQIQFKFGKYDFTEIYKDAKLV